MQTEQVQPAKRGRPLLPPNQRRTEVISFRLSPDELDSAYQFAIKHGEPLDRLLRDMLLRLVRKRS